MKYRKYIILLVAAFVSLTTWAENTLSVTEGLLGAAGKTITVPIEMTNSDEVVALQFNVRLPFSKASDDVTLNASRNVNGHSVNIRSLGSNIYTVVIVNMQNKPIGGNSGVLVNLPMTISSDAQPGDTYDISLSDVILTNKKGDNIQTGNSTGKLTIQKVPTPDLKPVDITIKETSAMPSGTLTVNWYVENIGDSLATAGWTENIYLVNSTTDEKIYIGNSTCGSTLVKKQKISRTATLTIPSSPGLDGDVYVAVTLVGNSGLGEIVADKANNTAQSTATFSLGKQLYLTPTDGKIDEDATSPLRMQLKRSGDWSTEETFELSLNDSHGLVSIPTSVTIPQNQTGVSFYVTPVNNTSVNTADYETVVVGKAHGYASVQTSVTVEDDEFQTMALTLSKSEITEGEEVTLTIDLQKTFTEDVTVSLSCELPRRFTMPNTVVIPAGSQTKDVTIKTVEDNTADLQKSVAFYGVANHFNKAEVLMILDDNDMPDIALELTPTTISEGAGLTAIMATIKRTTATNSAVTVRLSDNSDGQLYYPSSIQMAAGVENVQFNVGAVDNGNVDGDRTFTLTAAVYVSSCSCDAKGSKTGSTAKDITILDDDGPSLSMSLSSSMVQEGGAQGTTVTLKRNTATTDALTVTISTEDTYLDLPSSVTIPAGSSTATFTVKAKANDISGDTRTVVITATADGFTKGTSWLMISDETLPDAVISSITFPGSATVDAKGTIVTAINIQNNGVVELPKGVDIYVYAADECIDTLTTNVTVAPGNELVFHAALAMPDTIGVIKLYATINPEKKVTEVLFVNNTSPVYDVTLTAPYTATASVAKERYEAEETVVITGKATPTGSASVANVPVEVYIINEGMRFTVRTKTDENGDYATTFTPEAYLMGHFVVGACYPTAHETAEQDAFNIYGLRRVSSAYIKCETKVDVPYEGAILLQNPGVLDLTNVRVEVLEKADNYNVEFTGLSSLKGGEQKSIGYKITSTSVSSSTSWDLLKIKVTTDEEASFTTTLYCYARATKGQLKASISRINTTMIKDESRDYSFTITNRGDGSTGTISVDLPSNAQWMKCVTPIQMSALPKDSSATVILRLTPTDDMPLNVNVTGNIAINVENGEGVSIPFTVFPVSSKTGTLVVDVCDENTYYTAEAPHLQGAGVTVYNYSDNRVVNQGLTGEDGTFSCELPEGYYKISVTSNDHDSYTGNVLVDPGKSVKETVNLSITGIKVDWTVEETEVEDEYNIKTTVTYETSVPVPVVQTVFTDQIPIDLIDRDGYCICNAILTNKGLITAKQCSFELDETAGFDIEYLAENVQDIAPGTSIVIPVRLSYTEEASNARGFHGQRKAKGIVKCVLNALIHWMWYCGNSQKEANDQLVSDVLDCVGGGGGVVPIGGEPSKGGPGNPTPIPDPFSSLRSSSSSQTPTQTTSSCNECVNKIMEEVMKYAVHKIPVIKVIEESEEVMECLAEEDGECIASQLVQKNEYVEKIVGYTEEIETIIEVIEYCLDHHETHTYSNSRLLSRKKAGTVRSDLSELISNGDIPSYLGKYLERTINSMEHASQITQIYKELYGDEAFMDMTEIEAKTFDSGYELFKAGSIDISKLKSDFTPEYITGDQVRNLIERLENIKNGNTTATNYPDFKKLDDYATNVKEFKKLYMEEGFSGITDYMQNAIKEEQESESGQTGVCASIKLELNQTMTMTRQAFLGTLTVTNGNEVNPMTDVKLTLEVTDENGNTATSHEMQINPTSLTGFTGNLNFEDGWTLAPKETGVATVTFIPTKYAAPDSPVQYSFGGTLSYVNPYGGQTVTRSLYPVTLTVKPSPDLDLTYFMQRDLQGDNALTLDVVEPTVPGEFALLINNKGKGDATNVKVATEQPKIIENEKGLLIDFEILSSSVNGEDKTMALGGTVPADFGTISAGTQSYAQWELQSSLLGHFTSYNVSATHVTSYDNPDLSLLDQVTIHEMEHSIEKPDSKGNYRIGWLVNDIADSKDLPDAVYLSDATVQELHVLSDASITGTKTDDTHYRITVLPERPGWNYANIQDPLLGMASIKGVTRESDNSSISLRNFWQTEWTLRDGADPLQEYRLHFADSIPRTGETYILEFDPIPTEQLAVQSFSGPHEDMKIETSPLQKIEVNFNKDIDPATFGTEALTMRCQGKNVDLSDVTIDTDNNRNFSLDVSGVTSSDGYYVLSVATAGITDHEGFKGKNGKSVDWIQYEGGLINLNCKASPVNAGKLQITYTQITPDQSRGKHRATQVVTSNESLQIPYGETVTVVATPTVGYRFVGWYNGEELISTSETYTTNYLEHTELKAVFEETYCNVEIDYITAGGSVTGAGTGTYPIGSDLVLRAIASDEYIFRGWMIGNSYVSTEEYYTHHVDDNVAIYADFVERSYIINPDLKSFTKDLSATGYASFSAPVNVTIPEGVTAYSACLTTSGTSVILTEALGSGSVLSKNTGIILYGEGIVTLVETTDEGEAIEYNDLIATSVEDNQTIPSDGTCYALKANVAEFARVKVGTKIGANKAYLKTSSPNNANTLKITFADDVDDIQSVKSSSSSINTIYNLAGQRLSKMHRGINIVGDKKVIVK